MKLWELWLTIENELVLKVFWNIEIFNFKESHKLCHTKNKIFNPSPQKGQNWKISSQEMVMNYKKILDTPLSHSARGGGPLKIGLHLWTNFRWASEASSWSLNFWVHRIFWGLLKKVPSRGWEERLIFKIVGFEEILIFLRILQE